MTNSDKDSVTLRLTVFPRGGIRAFACVLCLELVLSACLLGHVHRYGGILGNGVYGVPYSRSLDASRSESGP